LLLVLNPVALESAQSEMFDVKSKLDEENEARLVITISLLLKTLVLIN
jgi:hypothetical protein